MDVYELNEVLQELLEASAGPSDAYAFETAWIAIVEYCKDHSLLEDNPGLVAESLLQCEGNVLLAIRQSHQRQGRQKPAYDTRKKVWSFLVELISSLEAQQLSQCAGGLLEAAVHHARVEENAHVRNAALEALTCILARFVDSTIPVTLLPDSPTNLASPLQRLYLSSEARDKSTLRASLLGVLGLLLQLTGPYSAAGQAPASQATVGQPSSHAASRVAAGIEVLSRHWLLQMCRGELADAHGQFSSAKANAGTVEGMVAALCLMQAGEADADLSGMLTLTATLLHELAHALVYKTKYEQYGKYKAATACLQQLGQRMAAAQLFSQPVPAALVNSPMALGGSLSDGQPASIGVVLIHDLMVICAGSLNKDMRNAAEAALASTAGLICRELLDAPSSRGGTILHNIIRVCNQELANVGVTAAATGTQRATSDAVADGSGYGSEPFGGSGWLRGAVEVLGQVVPAVAAYQGSKVVYYTLVVPDIDICMNSHCIHIRLHSDVLHTAPQVHVMHDDESAQSIRKGWRLVGYVEIANPVDEVQFAVTR